MRVLHLFHTYLPIQYCYRSTISSQSSSHTRTSFSPSCDFQRMLGRESKTVLTARKESNSFLHKVVRKSLDTAAPFAPSI